MIGYDVVLCRAAGNQPLTRSVWSVADDGVFICTQENYRMWAEQGIKPVVVKVPFSAVYEYDEHIFKQLNESFRPGDNSNARLEQLWLNAQPYRYQAGVRDE